MMDLKENGSSMPPSDHIKPQISDGGAGQELPIVRRKGAQQTKGGGGEGDCCLKGGSLMGAKRPRVGLMR